MTRDNGLQVGRANGNDVEAVHELAHRAVTSARSGAGPWYLEFETYRWREHCGPAYDNDLGYRDTAELAAWHQRCPVETFKAQLLERGEIDAADVQQFDAEIRAEIEAAFEFARHAPFPTADQLLARVYAEENA